MKKLIIAASVLMFAVPFISSASSFTISATAGTGGSISPAGAVSVTSGGTQSFSIGASSGMHVSDVTVDGSSVGTPGSYEFDNVTADHSINVSALGNGGGSLLWCSGPSAPGWTVGLPNGGCGFPEAPVYLPTQTVHNEDGSYTFGIVR